MYWCEAIKTNETDRYKLLVDHSPIGILLVGLDGEIIDINPKAVNILGSPSAEATKEINMLSYEPLEKAGVSEIMRRSLGGEKCVSGTVCYTTKWGKRLEVKFTAVPVFDDDKQVCFSHLCIEDVTDYERTKRELQRTTNRIKILIDTIEYLIWMKDIDGKYIQVNRAFAAFWERKCPEMIGLTDFDLQGPDAEKHLRDDREVISSGRTKVIKEFVDHPTLGRQYFKTTKSPVCGKDKKPYGTVGVAINITEQVEKDKTTRDAIKKLQAILDKNIFIK